MGNNRYRTYPGPTPWAQFLRRSAGLKVVAFADLGAYGFTATFPVNSIWAADRATYTSKSPGSTVQSFFLTS